MTLRPPAPWGLLLVLLSLAAVSCGGGQSSELQLEPPAIEDSPGLSVPGLPELSELPPAQHSVSLAGPGFKPITLYQSGGLYSSQEVTDMGDGTIRMNGGPKMALALYGVNGFDGDSFPTSVRLTTTFELGEYYIMAADYSQGRWVDIGPFTAGATIELPGVSELSPRDTYVSPTNTFYFAIVVTSGSGFDFSTLELGVHSGDEGPRPPMFFIEPEGGETLSIGWLHSPDYLDPDFAGYRLERAPLFLGDFEAVGGGLISGDNFADESVSPDMSYRYRLAAEDLAGHRSAWQSIEAHTVSGELSLPVCVVKGPQGTHYAPVFALFDLNESYDPEGIGIASYSVTAPLIGEQALADGTWNAVLSPGCHVFRFSVETTDGRTGSTMITLKAFPQWDSEPQLVKDFASPTSSRLLFPAATVMPGSGLNGMTGYDAAQQAVVAWQRAPDLANPPVTMELPAYWPVENLSKPFNEFGYIHLAAVMDGRIWLAALSEEDSFWTQGPLTFGNTAMSLAETPDNAFGVYYASNGLVSDDILLLRANSFNSPVTIKEDLGDLSMLSVSHEESNGDAHIFYQNGANVGYIRIDFVTSIIDEELVAGAGFQLIDSGINNESGRPGVMLYNGSHYYYSEMDDLGAFPAPAAVDNSELNYSGGSFTAGTNRPHSYFAKGAGQANLYEYVGGAWQLRSTPDYSNNSAFMSAMAEAFGAESAAIDLVDVLNSGEVLQVRVNEDGTMNEQYRVNAAIGQGVNLHAAADGSQIHLAWRNLLQDSSTQWISPDMGDSWGGFEGLTLKWLSVGTNSLGQFYYSGLDGAEARLYYWDGLAPVPQWSVPCSDNEIIPFLEKKSGEEAILWYAHDPDTSTSHILRGYFDSGVPATDFAENTVLPGLSPVWEGAIEANGLQENFFLRAGSFSPQDSSLALFTNGPDYDVVVGDVYDFPLDLAVQDLVRGRSMAAVVHAGPYTLLPVSSYFVTYGDTNQPMRVSTDFIGNDETVYYDMEFDPLRYDARRTVSTDVAQGATGVVLLSDVAGREHIMEWSNYGDWETLPLPNGLEGSSMCEFVVDGFGNWHIFYRDPMTDSIWRVSANRALF